MKWNTEILRSSRSDEKFVLSLFSRKYHRNKYFPRKLYTKMLKGLRSFSGKFVLISKEFWKLFLKIKSNISSWKYDDINILVTTESQLLQMSVKFKLSSHKIPTQPLHILILVFFFKLDFLKNQHSYPLQWWS